MKLASDVNGGKTHIHGRKVTCGFEFALDR